MRLLVVADGRPKAGLGHVIRSLAVAEAAQRAGHDVNLRTVAHPTIRALAAEVEVRTVDESRPQDDADAVLLDGYRFDASSVEGWRKRAQVVAGFVDFGATELGLDLVVNPNTEHPVEAPGRPRQLLGPAFAPIRSRFLSARREPSVERTLLVSTGGADLGGLGARIVEALPDGHGFAAIRVVTAGPAPRYGPPSGVEVLRPPVDLCQLMCQANAAIGAAGSTVWEFCHLGVPAAVVPVADNQAMLLETVAAAGAAIVRSSPEGLIEDLEELLEALADPSIAASLSDSGRQLVDGRGADRIVDALTSLVGQASPTSSHESG